MRLIRVSLVLVDLNPITNDTYRTMLASCESVRAVCAAVRNKRTNTLVVDFNEDTTFSCLVTEGDEMKAHSLQIERNFKSEILVE